MYITTTIYVSPELEYFTTDEPQYYTSTVWINKAPFKLLTAELFEVLAKHALGLDGNSEGYKRFEKIRSIRGGKK